MGKNIYLYKINNEKNTTSFGIVKAENIKKAQEKVLKEYGSSKTAKLQRCPKCGKRLQIKQNKKNFCRAVCPECGFFSEPQENTKELELVYGENTEKPQSLTQELAYSIGVKFCEFFYINYKEKRCKAVIDKTGVYVSKEEGNIYFKSSRFAGLLARGECIITKIPPSKQDPDEIILTDHYKTFTRIKKYTLKSLFPKENDTFSPLKPISEPGSKSQNIVEKIIDMCGLHRYEEFMIIDKTRKIRALMTEKALYDIRYSTALHSDSLLGLIISGDVYIKKIAQREDLKYTTFLSPYGGMFKIGTVENKEKGGNQ